MEKIAVHGLRLAYRRAGHGPPAMLVHGAAADSRSWAPQLDELSDEFTVLAWDEPGAGGSDDVPDTFGLSDYADALAEMIKALDLGRTAVLGLSWGTTVILEMWRRHPAVVSSMILAGGYAGWLGSLGAAEANARVEGVRRALAEPDETFDPTLPGLFAGEPPARFVPLLESMAADVRRPSMLVAMTAMAQADLTHVLPTISVPTRLIWGALDARSQVSVARAFERQIPGASLALIPDCGHFSNLEAPTQFNELVREFLRHQPVR